ncbi:hypothetical protein BJ973_009584 [Actinoplanes tereljensis]|uniref:Integrin beta 3 n=1 Tax=Paractinoplanes tereljensis TaxID=571912 RepID=A0A919NFE2_9ACTN|nr:hypothetical protein [Actinoplanes tereljensis]GIF17453.1 hypothetical protein Ate02nite_01830 [Actinoplanes tereljensis]
MLGAAAVGAGAMGAAVAKGAASAGAAPAGAVASGAASVGAASVGAATGAASVGAATGAASVGAASVGAASVGAASVGAASLGVASAAVKVGGAQAVPPRGESLSPSVGARAGAAKAAANGQSVAARPASPGADPETSGGLRGASNELRAKLRTQRRLRVVILLSLAVVVLMVMPAFFGLRSASKDPVFSSLDSLDVPTWAATQVDDQGSGSRWCFLDCRFREREADSSKSFKETTAAYTSALEEAGWQPWKVAECPETPIAADQGTYSCWKRDEFTLDLRVQLPDCAIDQVAAQDPSVITSAPATTAPAEKCVGSKVSIIVQNAIMDTRGKREPAESPDLIGETPDPVISNDPLLVPTPAAS